MRQVVLDVPRDVEVDRTVLEKRLESGARKALVGAECYKVKGECWETTTTAGKETFIRSYAFASGNGSSLFQKNFSKQSFATSNIELVRTRATRGGQYMSFFNRKPVLEQLDESLYSEARETTPEDMQGAKWVLLAARAFVMRFWSLLKVSSSPSHPLELIADQKYSSLNSKLTLLIFSSCYSLIYSCTQHSFHSSLT